MTKIAGLTQDPQAYNTHFHHQWCQHNILSLSLSLFFLHVPGTFCCKLLHVSSLIPFLYQLIQKKIQHLLHLHLVYKSFSVRKSIYLEICQSDPHSAFLGQQLLEV